MDPVEPHPIPENPVCEAFSVSPNGVSVEPRILHSAVAGSQQEKDDCTLESKGKSGTDISGEEGDAVDGVVSREYRPEMNFVRQESGKVSEPSWSSRRAKKKKPAGPQKQFLFPTRPNVLTRLPLLGRDPVSARQVSPPILAPSGQSAVEKDDQSGPFHFKPKISNFATCHSPGLCSPNSFECLDQINPELGLLESGILKNSAPLPFVSSAGHTPFPLVSSSPSNGKKIRNRTPLKPPTLAEVDLSEPPIHKDHATPVSPYLELLSKPFSIPFGPGRAYSRDQSRWVQAESLDLFPSPIVPIHMDQVIYNNKSKRNETFLISQDNNDVNLENENRDHEIGMGFLDPRGMECMEDSSHYMARC
ncbi:hypothetical protein NE237_001160 [Protea cynaroides]|uniref:Uncharacterized protein n=1 Tax=Protea cynaroides TaxID=273540 RepID=A0A9Q0KSZ9_9MAGN|nr:hypothetical protein NE237_001160 [Protea cynaroides]